MNQYLLTLKICTVIYLKTVENINKQLRRYYPKATDLSTIDAEESKKNIQKIDQQSQKMC